MTDDMAISYQAAVRGTPVLSSTGQQIGTLEHVLEVPDLDLFDGLVIATDGGLRFVDADHVGRITRSEIHCGLSDSEAAVLPAPEGPPVYQVEGVASTGHGMHDTLGRFFGRPHWKREGD